MLETEQQLIASLLLSPDDWVTRSVLADWYEENGNQVRTDLIRARLYRPYKFQTSCPRCNGGLIELTDNHGNSMLDIEVVRDYRDHRGPVAYRRCRECSGKGSLPSQHSRAWLTGLPCADEWLADHPTELEAMLDRSARPNPASHNDSEVLNMSILGELWQGHIGPVTTEPLP